jgi:hypothetical protein
VNLLLARETTYLIITTVLDIVTDILIISFPMILMWNIKIDLRRKISIFILLSLSLFMILVAIIRLAYGNITLNGRSTTDPTWLFFWQGIEASTAITMVSLTAFRSMLGKKKLRVENAMIERALFDIDRSSASESSTS